MLQREQQEFKNYLYEYVLLDPCNGSMCALVNDFEVIGIYIFSYLC
jgi:hypothetical protein